MKKQLVLWTMLLCMFTMGHTQEIIDFPDLNFKNAIILDGVDTNNDLEISIEEAEAVTHLDVGEQEIRDLSGIEFFINLIDLRADKNLLTEIDITHNINLTLLHLDTNELTTINVTENLNLEYLYLRYNHELSEIDVTQNLNLKSLYLVSTDLDEINVRNNLDLLHLDLNGNWDITEVDVTQNLELQILITSNISDLEELNVDNNINLSRLSTRVDVDVTNNINLTYLLITNSEMTEIDLTNNVNLQDLYLWGVSSLLEIDLSNQRQLELLDIRSAAITELDLRQNILLEDINFSFASNLQTVFMTNLQNIEYSQDVFGEDVLNVELDGCPNLQFICAEQQYLNDIYSLLEDADQTSCLLSDDCDDPHNRIQGNITYDLDNDGCGDEDDVPFTRGISMTAFSGTESIVAFPNDEGQYTLHVPDGGYKFLLNLDRVGNGDYFEIIDGPVFNPFAADIIIPDELATLTTDYCIQPIGDFDDLEVAIYPTGIASPGFTANYIIIYQNNGTTTKSGTITLDYQEDVLEYISAVPAATSNIDGQLTWNFTDLQPMQVVELPLTLELNRPTDTPALVGGEILDFVATINCPTDETLEDNVMHLAQPVVNSYDPNDKTCLEGDILDPDDVGNYLHYMIRFENEGTANARFISVIDVIDTTKFDIETLTPLNASHSFTTTITNGNEVEFFFQDINLPFDDANNDGYVIFKIKSLDTLVEGDEIVNSAAIYFDFNFPVITEDSVVKVERPEEPTAPQFSDYFTLSPNPTTGILNLGVLDDSIAVSYILLYDLNGDFVGFYDGTVRTMDVGYLFSRTYIMQIVTDKGEFSTQFIKI